MVNYPVPFVNNLPSSLSTYSSATQGFLVRDSVQLRDSPYDVIPMEDMQKTTETGKFLATYQKYRGRSYLVFLSFQVLFLDTLKSFAIHIYCNLFSCIFKSRILIDVQAIIEKRGISLIGSVILNKPE